MAGAGCGLRVAVPYQSMRATPSPAPTCRINRSHLCAVSPSSCSAGRAPRWRLRPSPGLSRAATIHGFAAGAGPRAAGVLVGVGLRGADLGVHGSSAADLSRPGALAASPSASLGDVSEIPGAVVVAVGLPLLALVTRQLGVLGLGDDLAAGLGVRAGRLRLLITALVVLLTASATAMCGPIAFVGFLSGPIARRLARGRTSIPAAALVGAAMVLGADHLSAYAVPGTAYPVGVVTGLAGAPVLVWLLVAGRRSIENS